MQVTRLQVRDFMGVREVDLVLPRNGVGIIGGRNGGGKSSALTALMALLVDAGAHPAEVVRRGASKAVVRAEFDDGMIAIQEFRRNRTPRLKVVDGNGEPMGKGIGGPQRGVLDKLWSKFTFDPMLALQMPDKELRPHLMRLAGIDWTALDEDARQVYAGRTKTNSAADQLEAEVRALGPHDPEAPAEPISTAELVAELERAQAHNRGGKELRQAWKNAGADVANSEGQIEHLERQLALLQAQIQQERELLTERLQALQAAQLAAENHTPVDEEAIQQRLARSGELNEAVAKNAARTQKAHQLAERRRESERATARLNEIKAEKQRQLEAATFPVEGLSFSDEGVLYNGLPLAQAEESARLRIAVAVGFALNPKLRTMICRYGSGLREESIELLKQIVTEAGGNLLLEHAWISPDKCVAWLEEGVDKRAERAEQLELGGK